MCPCPYGNSIFDKGGIKNQWGKGWTIYYIVLRQLAAYMEKKQSLDLDLTWYTEPHLNMKRKYLQQCL